MCTLPVPPTQIEATASLELQRRENGTLACSAVLVVVAVWDVRSMHKKELADVLGAWQPGSIMFNVLAFVSYILSST